MKILKNILLYTVLGGLFVIPFIPFLVPTAMFFPFITGKGFAFRIIVEILFGLAVALAFIDSDYRPKMSWITKAVLIFTGITLLADLFSANVYKSLWSNYERMEGFVLIAHLALFYLVSISVLNTKKRWFALFNTTIVASVLMAFYGLLQVAGKLTINQGGVRVDGTFGNATYLAIYFVFHIFICIYMFVQADTKVWQKWIYGIAAVLETVVLYYTATRGAILGLIGGLLLCGLILVWKERENKLLRKVSYVVIGGVIVLVLVFIGIKNTAFVKKSPVLSRFSTLGLAELETQGRYYVWPMAIKGFLQRPILGWGQESFNFVFNKYYDPRMYGQEQWFDRTHDIFLDWLINGGILGLLAYLSLYGALFYYVWRKNSSFSLVEKGIITGLIAAYVFHNIFVFDNLISYILFFTVLAYVHFMSNTPKGMGAYSTKTFVPEINTYVVLPLSVIGIILMIYFINVPAYEANRTLIQAMSPQGDVEKNLALFKKVYTYNSFGSAEATEQLVQIATQVNSAQVSDTVKQEFYDLAKEKIVDKVNQSPHDARYLVFAGSFFNQFGQYDEAIQYLTRAVAESPAKQTIYFELGTSYLGKNDLTDMFNVFKKAYDLEPTAQDSKIIYMLGAIYTKNTAVLQQMASQISPETIIGDDRFIKAYSDIGDYQSVINILNERLKEAPNNVQNKLTLASVYATIGQKQKAIDLINEVIAQNPSFKDQGEQYIKQIQG